MSDRDTLNNQVNAGAAAYKTALENGFPAFVNGRSELGRVKACLAGLGSELMKWAVLKKTPSGLQIENDAVLKLNPDATLRIAGLAGNLATEAGNAADIIREHAQGSAFLSATDKLDTEIAGFAAPSVENNPARKDLTVSIIGTAGRKDDARRITAPLYKSMVEDASRHLKQTDAERIHLVSGGAAVADHVAVSLFLQGKGSSLTLHLPAEFKDGKFVETPGSKFDPGRTANYYHRMFREKTGVDGLKEISTAIARGANIIVTPGFKERNTRVANDAEVLIAYTFGPGKATGRFTDGAAGHKDAASAGLKDGGTADTWGKSRAATKIHVPLSIIEETVRAGSPSSRQGKEQTR